MAHSDLSPSGSKRWLSCKAQPGFIKALKKAGKVPEDDNSVWSDEGTVAHDWCSDVLTGKVTLDKVPNDFKPHVKEWVEICNALKFETGCKTPLIEQKVPLFYLPEDKGTVDFAVWGDSGIHIRDFKYGQGVFVDAEENTQLAIYALSLIRYLESKGWLFDGDTIVTMGIFQPRYRGQVKYRIWTITLDELEEFCEQDQKITETAKEILTTDWQDLPFSPGKDVCQFCPAKKANVCQARQNAMFEGFPKPPTESDFSMDDLLPISEIPTKDLVSIYRNRKMIAAFLKEVETYVNSLAANGDVPEGLKFIRGRAGNWFWKPDSVGNAMTLLKRCGVDPVETQMISPAKAKEQIKERTSGLSVVLRKTIFETFEKYLDRPEGKIKLAPDTDKAPAVSLETAKEFFSAVDDEGEED